MNKADIKSTLSDEVDRMGHWRLTDVTMAETFHFCYFAQTLSISVDLSAELNELCVRSSPAAFQEDVFTTASLGGGKKERNKDG